MFITESSSADGLFEQVLIRLQHGPLVSPRGYATTEERGPTVLTLKDIRQNLITNPYRGLNYAFGLAEILWVLKGSNKLDMLMPYNKKIAKYSDDGITLAGAYGPPVITQLQWVINKLTEDRSSRQAVLSIWRPSPPKSKDIPCTVMLHFLLRDERLHCTTYMRSNDIWLGFPYDITLFTTIQRCIAHELNCGYGDYHHIVGSMHIYANNIPDITWALKYPGDPISTADPSFDQIEALVYKEYLMREDIPFEHGGYENDYYRIHMQLLLAYWDLKRNGASARHEKFPEPYLSLRSRIREVRAKFKDSADDSGLELNDSDSRHGG